MEKTSNVGRKVRIIGPYHNRKEYIGKTGIVTKDGEMIWEVEMEDGVELMPYCPSTHEPQCELLPEENEYHIDKLRGSKFWVATPTQEDWNRVCEVFQRAGIRWSDGREANRLSYISSGGILYNQSWEPKLTHGRNSSEHKVIPTEQFLNDNQPTMNKNTQALEQIELLKQQILKIEESLKEPVWEPKVGDWIANNKDGEIEQIGEKCGGEVYKSTKGRSMWIQKTGETHYRKATPEEIAANQQVTVTIGSSGIPVKISKGLIEADGKRIAIADLEITIQQTKQIEVGKITSWSVEVQNDTRFLKIGCSLFSPNEIQQVITEYKRINE